jgi:nitrite reductase (NADH) small subunit
VSEEVDVGASAEVLEGAPTVRELAGGAVALVRIGGQVFAVDNACPHRGGELGHGDLQGHHLYCPLHAWCFDVRTGEAFFPAGAKVPRFEVREVGGRVLVSR